MHALVTHLRAARDGSRPAALLRGLVLPLQAARFLAGHRSLWPLAAFPALINTVLFVGMVIGVLSYADAVLAGFWTQPAVQGLASLLLLVLWYGLYVATLIVGLLAAYALVLLVGGVLASPFNDALAVRTEQHLTGRTAPDAAGSFLRDVFRSLLTSAAILLFYLALMAPVLLLHLLPGFGSVLATVFGAGIGAFFLALEYTDMTLSRRGLGLHQKLRLLRRHGTLAGGFGLSTSLLLWIPVLNVLCVPIAVVGGTALALALAEGKTPGVPPAQ